jgi:hypothetical protein
VRKNAMPINDDGDNYSNLLGAKVKTFQLLLDPDGKELKPFAVFQDLKVRVRGHYRLKCSIFSMET